MRYVYVIAIVIRRGVTVETWAEPWKSGASVHEVLAEYQVRAKRSLSLLRRLIRQLLKRNPPERVGYQPSAGAHYVKQDPFFDGFDWRGLLQRRLPAPKTPHLTTVADVEAKGHRDLEVSLDEIPDWEPKLAKAGCCGGARVVEEWCDDF